MVEEHFLCERGALAEREQLEHLVFLAGEVHAGAADFDRLGIEVHAEIAGDDHRLRMALGAAHHGVDAGDQLILVEGFGHVVVGAEAQALHLVLDAGKAGEDEDGRVDLGDAKRLQNLVTRHVGEVQVQQNDVVIVELSEVDAFFAQIGRIYVEPFRLEHQFDALGRRGIILDQQYPHLESPMVPSPLTWSLPVCAADQALAHNEPLTMTLKIRRERLTNPNPTADSC